jgi:hypothetical protein
MMPLREQQSLFVQLTAKLIEWTYANGFELTFSEAYRSPQEAALNAKTGAGISNSLHCERLAIDLNLFKDGENLTAVSDYQPLGDYWKTLSPLARWGGDFKTRPDADHFSLTYGGIG